MEKISYERFKACLTSYDRDKKDTGERFRAKRLTYAFFLLSSVHDDEKGMAIGFVQGYLNIDVNHF